MKRQLLATGLLSISLLWSSPVTAAVFSKIYAFGDSLSDDGNVFAATGVFPPSPPYFQGHFSNGNVWVQNLAEILGIGLVDGAFGGATTGDENTLNGTFSGLPGLEQQISNFVSLHLPTADPGALYAIWAGANDYLPTNSPTFVPFATPDTTLNNIKTAVNNLANIGARKFVILNLPNLGELPRTRASLNGICPPNQQFDADCLNDLTTAHNTGLASLVASLNLGLQITLVDVNSQFDNLIDYPEQFGFTNVTEPCLNQTTGIPCTNSEQYLFWDTIHPTAKGHRLLGQLAAQALTVPEPTATLGLLILGTVGAVGGILRKKKT